MKTLVLFHNAKRELESTTAEVLAEFEAQGQTWRVINDPTMLPQFFVAVHYPTGYVLSSVIRATPEAVIETAKQLFSKNTKQQIEAVLRSVKEATGAPIQ